MYFQDKNIKIWSLSWFLQPLKKKVRIRWVEVRKIWHVKRFGRSWNHESLLLLRRREEEKLEFLLLQDHTSLIYIEILFQVFGRCRLTTTIDWIHRLLIYNYSIKRFEFNGSSWFNSSEMIRVTVNQRINDHFGFAILKRIFFFSKALFTSMKFFFPLETLPDQNYTMEENLAVNFPQCFFF